MVPPDPRGITQLDFMHSETHLTTSSELEAVFGDPSPVVFVTGSGAPRVGRAIAHELLTHGYRVVWHTHRRVEDPQELVGASLGDASKWLWLHGSIEDEPTILGWLEQILGKFGRVDGLVHSAAVWKSQTLESVTLEHLDHQWRANALGTFLLAKHFGLQMTRQAQGGGMVLVGDWAVERPYRDFAPYFLSKGTIPTLTRTMAVEMATRNPRVRVNAVLPGPVLLAEGVSQEVAESIAAEALLKRAGTPQDVARACRFLLEQAFITGVCLPVDGGRSIYAVGNSDPKACC